VTVFALALVSNIILELLDPNFPFFPAHIVSGWFYT
jgi:hypothetical protein